MTILLAPVAEEAATKVGGRVFRKQILRPGQLNYKGRTLQFTKEMFDDIVDAFHQKAYDTVPFMLAEADNSHTMRPERQAGEVIDLESTDDGLYGVIRLSEQAASIVSENSKFGVSARIKENLARGDGFSAKAAIQHVLGTFDPRVTGLSPWEAVELSEGEDEVIDLTVYTERKSAMAELTEEQIARLAAFADALAEEPDEDEVEDEDVETEESDDDEEMSLEEAEAILRDLEADAEPAGASLSNDDDEDESIELSALREEIAGLKAANAQSEWEKERDRYLASGVPPAMLDKAQILLSSPEVESIELSNGDEIDPRAVVRDLLREAEGVVDLSERRGHQGSDSEDTEYQALMEAWSKESGL